LIVGVSLYYLLTAGAQVGGRKIIAQQPWRDGNNLKGWFRFNPALIRMPFLVRGLAAHA
jgi:hypothetical protein